MDYFQINGGNRLKGKVRISGAKNAALPIMAATIMVEGETVLHGVPDLSDIRHMSMMLNKLGVATHRPENGSMHITVEDEMNCHAEYELVRQMRASVCLIGPLLAKRKKARVALPGGCAIGDRPIDLHIMGMEALGADSELIGGDLHIKAKKLTGGEIFLGGPFGSTVTGTANVMMAATLGQGRTIIESAACEPEVADLGNFLNACGAQIAGHGTPRITIEGVPVLHGCEYTIVPDRVEAGTFLIAAAITNGELAIENCRTEHMLAVIDRLRRVGVIIEREGDGVVVSSARRLEPVEVSPTGKEEVKTPLGRRTASTFTLRRGGESSRWWIDASTGVALRGELGGTTVVLTELEEGPEPSSR